MLCSRKLHMRNWSSKVRWALDVWIRDTLTFRGRRTENQKKILEARVGFGSEARGIGNAEVSLAK